MPEFIRRVKGFAKRFEIVGSADGHLNSYAWTLLAVYFLQRCSGQPIVPNLQALRKAISDGGSIGSADGSAIIDPPKLVADKRWGEEHLWDVSFFEHVQALPQSLNRRSVDELCVEFFHFYAESFAWDTRACSVRLGLTAFDSPLGAVRNVGVDRRHLSEHMLMSSSEVRLVRLSIGSVEIFTLLHNNSSYKNSSHKISRLL